ncbi:M24 family metallopeptidase [Paenibacillus ginsengarvi]|uniref:Aminopeptidase P family protein n=1 Tax=Paenibacillus ginsengarvi TaxID=400777 RepID=A0A3B0BF49_9BACL|nr:Xaa-Pro peptidase family protein [Paenibacillus ginsengarvi]RKN71843.1 aminopeptidase P family protein [Paenibacillus ginsengarvi]
MDERSSRRQRLQHKMKETGIDLCVVTQNVDLYYFVGSMQTGYLFIPAEGESIFYVRRSFVRASDEADIAVEELGSMRGFGSRLTQAYPELFRKPGGEQTIVAAEYDVLPVQQFQRLEGALPGVKWVDGSTLIRELRMIKSPGEIAAIRESARVIDIAYETAIKALRVGMPEVELMAIVESVIRHNGHMGLMRVRGYNQEIITGMIGAGSAAAMPTYFDGPAGGQGLGPASPQSSGRRPIEANEPILIDIGCCIDGYVIDQTRTAVIGELPADLREAYELSEAVMRRTEAMLKPGVPCEELYTAALEQVRVAGLSEHFMGFGGDQVKFLGHGIGLEIDELPVLAKGFRYPLQPGMVIAIEPKFTFPGRGVVGIENSYAITEDGFEKLTVSREGIAAAAAPF